MASSESPAVLKRTPLHGEHVRLGGKMVPFAGHELPVQYPTGITAEHKAVREACGMFDVSHMGEFIVRGSRAIEFCDYVTTNNVAKLVNGQAHYSTICNERGTIEDDCLVYRIADDHLMMVVNGSNREKDLAHVSAHAGRFGVQLEPS
jgi:aminomethyltransferase